MGLFMRNINLKFLLYLYNVNVIANRITDIPIDGCLSFGIRLIIFGEDDEKCSQKHYLS